MECIVIIGLVIIACEQGQAQDNIFCDNNKNIDVVHQSNKLWILTRIDKKEKKEGAGKIKEKANTNPKYD